MKKQLNYTLFPFLLSLALFLLLPSCESDENDISPVDIIRINNVSNINTQSVDIQIEVMEYHDDMEEFYLVWSSNENLDLGNPTTDSLQIVGIIESDTIFQQPLEGKLEKSNDYYAAAVIHYSDDRRIQSETVSFATLGDFTTSYGHIYKTVKIGDQTWMAENLRTEVYADGSPISSTFTYTNDEDDDYEDNYGLLYTYSAIEEGEICPEGWSVPSDEDWSGLGEYVSEAFPSAMPGEYLKSSKTYPDDHPRWDESDASVGLDRFGFNVLPGGYRYSDGNFGKLGQYAMFWTSTEANEESDDNPKQVWRRQFYHDQGVIGRYYNYTTHGFSIRCIKDSDDDEEDNGDEEGNGDD